MKSTRFVLGSLGLLAALCVGPRSTAWAQTSGRAPSPWLDVPAARSALASSIWAGRLTAYRVVTANANALAALANAPLEGSSGPAAVLALPTPDGGMAHFRIVEAPVMEPALAAQYPQIKTYAGIGLDDPTATLRADLTPGGFHAQVLSRRPNRSFYIDPVDGAHSAALVSYWRQDLLPRTGASRATCHVRTGTEGGYLGQLSQRPGQLVIGTPAPAQTSLGGTLRTYRLALAATGEYTAFTGGTVTSALSAMTTSVNRVTGVYEKELGVRLVLVANTNLLIFTNAATDPYTNNDGELMLTENQTRVNSVIGSANYDIGHVFSTGGGGIAGLGVVCGSSKAEGVTGSDSPINDAFDIDYVAHEMGHQFGGNHPFNGSVGSCSSTNRNGLTAWEPGSGSTIMAYAGICDGSGTGGTGTSQDLQAHSDAYFHGGNISEMMTFITSTSCAVSASSGNTPPTVTTPVNKSIPSSTPFRLTGAATDAEGDALTYDWEEMDLGAQSAPVKTTTTQTINSTLPLFRSWSPTASPVRYFPRLNELRNNTVAYGEVLPTVARLLKFRCTVRDQHFSSSLNRIVGGVNQSNTVTLTVVNTGAAFAVTAPNTAVSLTGGAGTTVTWNVAGTTANGINCATVNILLSTDGGLTFPTTLATGVANSGTAAVTVPNTPTTTARIMVAAADNYFFDISNANFIITAGGGPAVPTITSFTPGSGPVGTVVTITGTNFTGATAVRFNGTNASTYTVSSATSINATVAAGSTTGAVTVVTAGGTATSGTAFTVTTGTPTTRTLVNYDFNAGTSYATLVPVTATNVTATASSTEAFVTYSGVATTAAAFVANTTAGNALAMANSSGTDTRYFQFALGGSALGTYGSYKVYCQTQRSSTGAATLTLAYSTNGTTFTNVAPAGAVATAFNAQSFDLSSISALNNQASVTFRLLASGASGAGTLRVDNFQVQATSTARPLALAPDALAALTLWPNPAHGTVRVSDAPAHAGLLVIDLTGRAVRRFTADEAGTATLDLAGLAPGVYVVRAGEQTRRLVVE